MEQERYFIDELISNVVEFRIVPNNPPPYDMNVMRCPEKVKSQGKEFQCLLFKGHFGVHKFENKDTTHKR